MTHTIPLEIPLSPLLLIGAALYLLTFLLRHRLYFYASAGRIQTRPGVKEHVFIIQNLEDVDLGIPLKVAVSTTNNVGGFVGQNEEGGASLPVVIYAGKQGPHGQVFKPDGQERWSIVINGIPALDTWKVVCTTNDEAERVRMTVRGWDMRRNLPRWWYPAFPLGGIAITSRASSVQSELSRPARYVAWASAVLLIWVYVLIVRGVSQLHPDAGAPVFVQAIARYAHGLFPLWQRRVDWAIVAVLAAVAALGALAIDRREGVPIPLGYLGDEYLTALLREYDTPRKKPGK